MKESTPSSSFMDPKTILAIALVGLAWLFWDYHMKSKYPQLSEKSVKTEVGNDVEKSVDKAEALPSEKSLGVNIEKTNKEAVDILPERILSFSDGFWSFDISSNGMSIKNLILNHYFDRNHQPKKIGDLKDNTGNFATGLIGRSHPLSFQLQKVDERHFVGVAHVGEMVITKSIEVDSENFSLNTSVKVSGISGPFEGLFVHLGKSLGGEKSQSMMASFGKPDVFVSTEDDTERTFFPKDSGEDNKLYLKYTNVNLAAFSSQYFSLALIDQSQIMPTFRTWVDRNMEAVLGEVKYQPTNRDSFFDIKYLSYLGPKSTEILKRVDDKMLGLIDFGMFSFFGHQILKLMKFFYILVHNWGIAIILLTLLVRLLLLPINISSHRSMKAMQIIQPELKLIREKFKDDPQKLNQETMRLMKEAKANPIGGCLPMLLQLPVFIALYQVLGQSIELYQAPFGLWIHDLSLKDPYYVLPVLMGLTMFTQQKITPTAMDPAQAKIMMFMPLIFCFFMLSLPSGLTLYIFVSSLFGVFQQMYFIKEKSEVKKTVMV